MTSPVQSTYRLEGLLMKYIERGDIEGIEGIAKALQDYPEDHQKFNFNYQRDDGMTVPRLVFAQLRSSNFSALVKSTNKVLDAYLNLKKK